LGGIFCARGGYGALRLLDSLEPSGLTGDRLFVGFSDITALHALLNEKVGVATVHGPVVASLGRMDRASIDALQHLLFEPEPLGEHKLASPVIVREGRATG